MVFFSSRGVKILLLGFLAIAVTGCAAEKAKRSEYGALPQLDKGWSRIYVSSGRYNDGSSTGLLGNKNVTIQHHKA